MTPTERIFGQHREVLIHRLLQVRLGDLIAEDEVRVAQDVELILGHRAEARGWPGPGPGTAGA